MADLSTGYVAETLPCALHPEAAVQIDAGKREKSEAGAEWWAAVYAWSSGDFGFDSVRVSRYGKDEREARSRAVAAWNAKNAV